MSEANKYTPAEFFGGAVAVMVAAPIFLLVTFPITMACAWCDMRLWNWFAAPYLHLGPMPFWVAVGIGLWIRLQTGDHREYEGQKLLFWRSTLGSLVAHFVSVGIGYVLIHHFFQAGAR